MNRKIIACVAAWLFAAQPALALNDTIGVTAGSGKTVNLISFAGGNVISETGICDATTANRCATVSAGGAVLTDASATTQPVSAASLPLPTGAATSALQTTGNTALTTINTTLGAPMQATGGTVGLVAGAAAIGTVNPTTIATWGLAAIGGTTGSPTNALAAGCQYNSSAPTFSNGDVGGVQCTATGSLHATVDNTPPVSQSGTWTVQPGNTANTTPWLVQGNVSNASSAVSTGSISTPTISYTYGFNGTTWDQLQVDASKNLKVTAVGISEGTAVGTLTFSALGAEGLSTEKTAVTTANYGRLVSDLVGKLIVMPYAPNQLWVKGTTAAMTGTASVQLIAAVASNRVYLTTLTCGNSHATVGTFVNVQDGSGGTTLWTVPAAAIYGGATLNFQPPIGTTNGNGVYVADATTGANVICSGTGYSGV